MSKIKARNYTENKLFSTALRMNGDYINSKSSYPPLTIKTMFIELGQWNKLHSLDRISGYCKSKKLVRDAIEYANELDMWRTINMSYLNNRIKKEYPELIKHTVT